MVILCAFCCFINYADRVNLSVAIIAIGEDYDFSLDQQGLIMSSFFLGYLPMQVGGAVLCRRFGGKKVLSYGAFLWSMFTFCTPFACAMGYYPLLVCRVLMGLSEGVAFPSVYHFLSAWVPVNERGRSVSIFLTGVHAGTTCALVLSPIIIRVWSWQVIFYIFGAAGLVWIAAWNLLAHDRDSDVKVGARDIEASAYSKLPQSSTHGLVDADSSGERNASVVKPERVEKQLAHPKMGNGVSVVSRQPNSCAPSSILLQVFSVSEISCIRFILTSPKCMAVCITQALFGFVHYTILSWLPSYFKHVFHTETGSLSFTFLPYISMAIAANIGGYAADRLHERGMSLTNARKVLTFVANVGAAILLIAFSLASTVPTALLMISMSMAFMSLNSGGFESCYLDMSSPSLTGTFKAVANTMASFAGLVAIPFSTLVLRWADGSWRLMFRSLVVWYGISTVVFCKYASSEKVLVEEDTR